MTPALSVVIPTFNSHGTLQSLLDEIHAQPWWKKDYEVVIVDDGNSDKTWATIRKISDEHHGVIGVRLSKNFGQHAAILAGIRSSRGDVIVTIDDDLQNPPKEIIKLIDALDIDTDLVYGVPDMRCHPRWRRVVAILAKRSLKAMLGFRHATLISSFRVFRRSITQDFPTKPAPGISIDAFLSWSTVRIKGVTVEHRGRSHGTSNYTIRSLIGFLINTATTYSTIPLKLASFLGALFIALSAGLFVWVTISALVTTSAVPGFPFLVGIVTMFSGVQLTILGILGQYLARIHLQVLEKPAYIIAETTTA